MARAVLPRASAHAIWLLTGCSDAVPSSAFRAPPLDDDDVGGDTDDDVGAHEDAQDDNGRIAGAESAAAPRSGAGGGDVEMVPPNDAADGDQEQ